MSVIVIKIFTNLMLDEVLLPGIVLCDVKIGIVERVEATVDTASFKVCEQIICGADDHFSESL